VQERERAQELSERERALAHGIRNLRSRVWDTGTRARPRSLKASGEGKAAHSRGFGGAGEPPHTRHFSTQSTPREVQLQILSPSCERPDSDHGHAGYRHGDGDLPKPS
jgi:hypothetical protein